MTLKLNRLESERSLLLYEGRAYRTKLESFPDMQAIQARYSGAIYLVESVKNNLYSNNYPIAVI